MNRREFSKNILGAVTSYTLFNSIFATSSFASAVSPITRHWAIELNEYCADLKKASVSPGEWQSLTEQLFQRIQLDEILQFIDFEKLTRGFSFPDIGVKTKPVFFPRLSGLPDKTVFVKKIFGVQKGRAIIPHGHTNMASAHLVLKGNMHLRHYEKVSQEDNRLIIKPAIDKMVKPGDSSSISDERNNIHWFIASSASAFTLDIIMLDLMGKNYDIQNLDIYEKENLGDGTMRVPILDVETALKKYGKEMHH